MSAIVTYPTTDNLFNDSPKITLDKILQALTGGGSGGGGGVLSRQVYIDRDPSPPDNVSVPAINLRSDGGSWTMWNPSTAAWS